MAARPIISEVLKITVDRSFKMNSPEFSALRAAAVQAGVKEQYYGMPIGEPNHLCWIIQWPADVNPEEYKGPEGDFRARVNALDVKKKPTVWYFPFEDAKLPRPALTAPVCQLCTIYVKQSSNVESLMPSLHKTFTDCYLAPDGGFTGGNWGIALNDPKMAYYFLGWKTRKHHDLYARTPLFDVEIDKLMPHMAGGWGHYIKLTQEMS